MYGEVITQAKSVDTCFLKNFLTDAEYSYPVLDLGGGHHWSYHRYLGTDHNKTISTNLPRAGNIDVAMDAEAEFPFNNASFSSIFAFNILEHLYDYQMTLDEVFRVLEPGGKLLLSVPFIHRIHGDPNDFHRFTESALREMLSEFEEVSIYAHSRGPVSAGQQLMVPLKAHPFSNYLSWRVANLLDYVFDSLSLYSEETVEKYPLYYIIEAIK